MERRLCEECAASRGVLPAAAADAGGGTKPAVAAGPGGESGRCGGGGLTAHGFLRRLEERPAQARGRCPSCGSTYAEIRRTGVLGCAVCYTTFRMQIEGLLQRIHGAARHRGKAPAAAFAGSTTAAGEVDAEAAGRLLARLKSQLRVAVEMEAFEDAAALRDRIRGIEKAPVDATRAAVRGDRADGERDGA